MTSTAALIRNSGVVVSALLYGSPIERRRHPLGAVVVLPPGEVFLYCIRTDKYRCFLFRTLDAPEALSTEVPGVSPRARLLVQTQTLGRLRRLQELLAFLDKEGIHPSILSDRFYLRLNAIFSGKLPKGKVIRSLLAHESPTSLVT